MRVRCPAICCRAMLDNSYKGWLPRRIIPIDVGSGRQYCIGILSGIQRMANFERIENLARKGHPFFPHVALRNLGEFNAVPSA